MFGKCETTCCGELHVPCIFFGLENAVDAISDAEKPIQADFRTRYLTRRRALHKLCRTSPECLYGKEQTAAE
jgi:hypothetical protein